MIKSKEDLRYYLEQDRLALWQTKKKPGIIGDEIWKLQILLRKCEYVHNCKHGILGKIHLLFLKLRYRKIRIKLGVLVPLNVFGPGLSIAHYGTIIVNDQAVVGKNCRIHEGVTIGGTSGKDKYPVIGDNVFIGTGAKIIGDVNIANDIAIGANSVVTKSFDEPGITIAGIPAMKISDKNSYSNLSPYVVKNL